MAANPCPLRVLVVDDSRDSADSLAIMAHAWNHEAQVAYCGASALALKRLQLAIGQAVEARTPPLAPAGNVGAAVGFAGQRLPYGRQDFRMAAIVLARISVTTLQIPLGFRGFWWDCKSAIPGSNPGG